MVKPYIRKKSLLFICKICKKKFFTYSYDTNRKYCSNKCYGIDRRTSLKTKCSNCKRNILVKLHTIKVNKNNFCCRKCLVKYHKKNGKYNTIKYNKSLGYLFGAIVGDGTINISKSTHMPRFKLNVKDKDFANSFANAIYNICNYRPPINIYYAPYRKYKHNYCNNLYYKVSFHSDSFYKLYNKKFDNIINKYPINFLKGVYDAEGYVTLRKDKKHFVIGLGMTNKKIIYLIRKHLDKLNITHKLFIARTRTTNRPYYKIYISNTDSIELFKQKINFSITRKSERLNGNPKYINSINYNTK